MSNSAREILYPGKALLNNSIVKGMNMEQVSQILAAAIEMVYANQSLESLNLKDFGIECSDDDANTFTAILTSLLKSQLELSKRLSVINNFFTNVQQSTSSISDEKVKVTKDSQTSKYLSEAFEATPGKLKIVGDKVKLTGLIPIGARMTISQARKGDFDASGKGKAGTDLEGWAIRNGGNGLDNALGRFPMYTDTLENAGKKAGSNSKTFNIKNIEAFTLNVSGDISDSLVDPVEIEIPILLTWDGHSTSGTYKNKLVFDNGTPATMKSTAKSLKHTHSHTLKLNHVNAQPTPVELIPEHVKEIPIEYIGL